MTIPIEILYADARDLATDLLPRLARLIPETPTVIESRIGSHGKVSAAPTPWNDPAAMLYFEIIGDARANESALTLRLHGKATYRPATDDHTRECINRLPILIAHARETLNIDDGHELIAHQLHTWGIRAREALDETRPEEARWAKAPGNLLCPYCDQRLELMPGWQERPEGTDVVCRRCRDAHGHHLRWTPNQWLAVLQDTVHDREVDDDGHELVTAKQACERWGLSADTIYVWVHRGHLIVARRNRRGAALYRVDAIEERIGAGTGMLGA